jgi:Mn-containing catalase
MSRGEDARGPWNEGTDWEFVEDPQPAVETETARHACCQKADIEVLKAMATRTASDPSSDLVAGTDLRSGSAS